MKFFAKIRYIRLTFNHREQTLPKRHMPVLEKKGHDSPFTSVDAAGGLDRNDGRSPFFLKNNIS